MTARMLERGWSAAGWVIRAGLAVFCLGPAVLVIALSLFSDGLQRFPPKHFTLSLYGKLFTSGTWGHALVVSLEICVPATILTILLVVPAVLAIERGRIRGKALVELGALVPLLIPATSYAVSIYVIYLQLGWVGRLWPLVMIEAIAAVPPAFLVVRGAVRQVGPELEFVALSLGASRGRALLDVTGRLILPAVGVGGVFAFLTAFDDAMFVTFLGGPGQTTVSKAIFDSLRFQVDPLVAPLSALLMIAVAALVAGALYLRERATRATR